MKKIIHIDMDYFYAQVEILEKPELRDRPVAIGGMNGNRGVLCTSNYIARNYGVRSAMATSIALKKCPDLILIPPNFKKYKEISEIIFSIFKKYSDKIERLSLDEAYIDVSDCQKFENDAIKIAKAIKEEIFEKTKLTASAGVSYNKLLAKIGSDLYKPNGLAVLRPENIEKKIAHFSVKKIWGVGKVTFDKMNRLGIHTFGDLQKLSKLNLINSFGDFGANLYNYCRGVDSREVNPHRVRKSLSVEHTFSEDKNDLEDLIFSISACFNELEERLKKNKKFAIKNIIIKIKYFNFEQTTNESQIEFNLDNYIKLFKQRYKDNSTKIRLIGLGVKFYSSDKTNQLELPL